MKLILNPQSAEGLHALYRGAFLDARELYVVSAYLTKWDSTLRLNPKCKIRVLIGKDFGITRKQACKDLLDWLPASRKNCFFAAQLVSGFHPKAIFWQDSKRDYYILVGSSNLTEAAFGTNYEANIYSRIDAATFEQARKWVNTIVDRYSCVIDDGWLHKYRECPLGGRKNPGGDLPAEPEASSQFPTPELSGNIGQRISRLLRDRRRQARAFREIQNQLRKLFRLGAAKRLTKTQISTRFVRVWGKHTSRFQGKGWERSGMNSNFQSFAKALVDVLDAPENSRDWVVADTIDRLARERLPTRKALFSEMLCHFFPDQYPLINGPVQLWLKDMKYRTRKGASEGARYIDLASRMRATLFHNNFKIGRHKVRTLAELDIVIWAKYERKYYNQRRRYL